MRAIAARVDAARWLSASGPLQEGACFSATCPRCRQEQLQRGYTHASLFRLLDADLAVEAFCASCREFWALNPRERLRLAQEFADY